MLATLNSQGLLDNTEPPLTQDIDSMDDDELLAELEGTAIPPAITDLRHVSSTIEKRVAEAIAHRDKCKDFDRFQPLLKQIESELRTGVQIAKSFGTDSGINVKINTGDFFILGGQIVHVAETGEAIKAPNGESDARLRVIYNNGTGSNLLRRSLQRALYKDEAGRRIIEPAAGPLFSDTFEDADTESGTIYVLRSLSTHPFVVEHRELIHKIGVTGGKVESRITNAAYDATYLLADVEVIATYKLAGINRTQLDKLLHRIFAAAQIEFTIRDRFGRSVKPKEWFLVPLHVIDEAVQRIREGSIINTVYDPQSARLRDLAE